MEANRFAKGAFIGAFAATGLMVGTPAFAERLDGVYDDAKIGDIVFSMDRKGKTIGNHSVRYTPLEDGTLQVDVTIAIKVKFAFITAYRYEHRNTEIWSADGETLLAIDVETNNNGTNIKISGQREGDVFLMTDEDGVTREIEGSVMPTSYWNAGVLNADAVILNTQKGVVEDAYFDPKSASVALMPSGPQLAAQLYEVKGSKLNRIFVDYTERSRCWVGLEFFPPKQDVKISYTLTSHFETKRPELEAYDSLAACMELESAVPIAGAGDSAANKSKATAKS